MDQRLFSTLQYAAAQVVCLRTEGLVVELELVMVFVHVVSTEQMPHVLGIVEKYRPVNHAAVY